MIKMTLSILSSLLKKDTYTAKLISDTFIPRWGTYISLIHESYLIYKIRISKQILCLDGQVLIRETKVTFDIFTYHSNKKKEKNEKKEKKKKVHLIWLNIKFLYRANF